MNDTERTSGTNGIRTDAWRQLALAGGIAYLMTFIFSIPAVFLYGPVLTDPAYILSAGADSQVLLGALFDLITALACIGTAVALYPVIKRQSSAASIGFVATRIFEAGVIVIGVVCLMAVVNLRQAGAAAGTDASALVAVGQGLVAVRDVTFLVGPGVMPGLERAAAWLRSVPVAPRAARHPRDGAYRRPAVPGPARAASILGLNEQASLRPVSRSSRSSSGSCRSASGSPSRASGPRPLPPLPLTRAKRDASVAANSSPIATTHRQVPHDRRATSGRQRSLRAWSFGRPGSCIAPSTGSAADGSAFDPLRLARSSGCFASGRLDDDPASHGSRSSATSRMGRTWSRLAMNGWAEAEPAWWLNLQARPDTIVELTEGSRAVHGRAAEGEERDRLWARWRELSDDYDAWAAMRSGLTAVVVLEPRVAKAGV